MTVLHITYKKQDGRFFATDEDYKFKLFRTLGNCEVPFCIHAIGPRKVKPFFVEVRVDGKRHKVKVIPSYVEEKVSSVSELV